MFLQFRSSGSMLYRGKGSSAISHTAERSLALLHKHFGRKIISRTDIEYTPHSPDLTSPDAYIWGTKNSIFRPENPRFIWVLSCSKKLE